MGRGPSIENRKGAEDARRGKLFTKLIREVTVAARNGADPAGNPRLRMAMDKALSANMTKDTLERAIKRGSGAAEGAHLDEIRYEGYGPGGVAILLECMTDNATRTVAEVRHAFARLGGHLGASGSVAYLFHRIGVLRFHTETDEARAEKILEAALDASADDVQTENGWTEVTVAPDHFEKVRESLTASGLKPDTAEITLRPATTVELQGEAAGTVHKLLSQLDELEDVQHVYSNARLPDTLDTVA